MRAKEFIAESSPTRLKDLCTVKTNFPDADFWLQRNGSETTVGIPTKTFSPDNIGIKVTATDVLDPKYLYYMMMHIHNTGYWKARAKGALRLVHIKASDVADMSVGNNSVEESTGLPFPGTYEQEYGRFKSKGPERLTAMTNEALDSKPYEYTSRQEAGGFFTYEFTTENNLHYVTTINWFRSKGDPDMGVEVMFYMIGEHGIEQTDIQNTGDARRVFATVIDIVKNYVAENKPKEIVFTAAEPSRIRLYDAFVKRLDRELPDYFEAAIATSYGRGHYYLKRKEGKEK